MKILVLGVTWCIISLCLLECSAANINLSAENELDGIGTHPVNPKSPASELYGKLTVFLFLVNNPFIIETVRHARNNLQNRFQAVSITISFICYDLLESDL